MVASSLSQRERESNWSREERGDFFFPKRYNISLGHIAGFQRADLAGYIYIYVHMHIYIYIYTYIYIYIYIDIS
jgi:hypothetical protein